MITLYGMGSPNVCKVILMLEEAELPYEFRAVDVIGGEQFDSGFLALNPNGKVPVLVDRRDPEHPVTLFESGAILLYLSETTGVLWPDSRIHRYEVLKWVMFQMANIGPVFGQAIHFTHASRNDGYGRTRFSNEMHRLLGVLNQRLSETGFIAGDAYSIADVAHFPWIRVMQDFFPEIAEEYQAIRRWFATVGERPAVKRAVVYCAQLSERDMQRIRNATRQELDSYFGRIPRSPAAN